MRRIQFHIRKTRVEIVPLVSSPVGIPIVQASLVLNDFAPYGVELVSNGRLDEGTAVRLRIRSPIPIEISGRIAFCRAQPSGQWVISDFPVTHRVGIQFQPSSEEEKQAIAQYCQEVAHLIMPGAPHSQAA